MSRIDFLVWILMIVVIFWVYSIGKEGLAFFFMSIYAIFGGILYRLETALTKRAMDLLDEDARGLK